VVDRHLLVCECVCLCICLSGALWQNSLTDIDAVWGDRLDGSGDEAGTWVWVTLGVGMSGAPL